MSQDIYRRPAEGQHPPNLSPEYKSTPLRSPRQAAIVLPQSLSEITGPLLADERLDALENDLTKQRSDRKSTRLNSSHSQQSRMPSSA